MSVDMSLEKFTQFNLKKGVYFSFHNNNLPGQLSKYIFSILRITSLPGN